MTVRPPGGTEDDFAPQTADGKGALLRIINEAVRQMARKAYRICQAHGHRGSRTPNR